MMLKVLYVFVFVVSTVLNISIHFLLNTELLYVNLSYWGLYEKPIKSS